MKRFWIGTALLVILLGAGIGSSVFMDHVNEPLWEDLKLASQAALEGRWEEASRLVTGAKDHWEQHHNTIAAIFSHQPMEQIDAQFETLVLYLNTQETIAFSACCTSLSAQIQALADAHIMSWWNLF